jgi:acetyl esterase/lipase
MNRRTLLAGGVAMGYAGVSGAQTWGEPPTPALGDVAAPLWPADERIALWPGKPPGMPDVAPTPSYTMNGPRGARELWIRGVAQPELNVFRAARPDGSALLVLPGGGYEFLSVQNEGIDVARRYTAFGTQVFVLTYRLPAEGWAQRDRVPLQDAQRAMRVLRSDAQRLSLDPRQIGVVGFSAGGHLAADLCVAFDEPAYAPIDAVDELPARPRCAGLIYPVVSLQSGAGHVGSRERLLGASPSAALVARRSPVERVRPDMPPVFIVHAANDPVVPADASLQLAAACRRAKVAVEAHLFEDGGHGFGLHSRPDLPVARWPDLFEPWMRAHMAAGG